MIGRQAEPGGHKQRTEFVTIQRDRVGLVIHSRTSDVRGGRMIQEFLFDRVLVEPRNGA